MMRTAPNYLVSLIARLKKDPLGLAGLIIVITVLTSAVFAAGPAPHDPLEVDVTNRLASPSWRTRCIPEKVNVLETTRVPGRSSRANFLSSL